MIAFDAHHEKPSVSTQAGGTVFGFPWTRGANLKLGYKGANAWQVRARGVPTPCRH